MTVYEQLKTWQKIPHARREWAAYRQKLTGFVLEQTKPDTAAAILGVGHCDDLDLATLSHHFRKIILVDREPDSMDGATEGWQLEGGCSIQKQEHDFLGITESEYLQFSGSLQQGIRLRGKNTDIRDLADLAKRELEPIYQALEARPLELVSGACDYLIVAGVHSQLDNMLALIWNAYEQALGQHAPWMYPYFARHSDRAVGRFDEKLIQTAREGIVCALENKRLGIPGGVQGAARGIRDLKDAVRMGRLECTAQDTMYWNFDIAQGIAYEMNVVYYKVRQ